MGSEDIHSIDYSFEGYGITIMPDGTINGPKRPEQYAQTPKYIYTETSETVFDNYERAFLVDYFEKPFSQIEHQKVVLSIVDKIVKLITGNNFDQYTNIIIMTEDDWNRFSQTRKEGLQKTGITGDFHGIDLGGLVILRETGKNNFFPLLFHEIGHTFYTITNNIYLDELRAMYFQILCTKKLEQELRKIGINTSYPEDFFRNVDLPSEDHRLAFQDARYLFSTQRQYDAIVKGSDRVEQNQAQLLEKVKQNQRSFQ